MIKQHFVNFNGENNFSKTDKITSIPIFETKKKGSPKFTIAIPTYKRAVLLKDSLESALNQLDIIDYDVIVVDNDPTRDCDTEKMMSQYKNNIVSYYKNSENIGMVGNWNRLFSLAKGEWVVMLHDDDLLFKNFLVTILRILKLNPGFDFYFPPYIYFNGQINDSLFATTVKPTIGLHVKYFDFLFGNVIGPPVGMYVKKDTFISSGGFSLQMYPSIDFDFYTYVARTSRLIKLTGNPICLYRISVNESMKDKTLIEFVRKDLIIKNHILQSLGVPIFSKLMKSYNKTFSLKYLLMMKLLYNNINLSINEELKELDLLPSCLDRFTYFTIEVFKKMAWKIREFTVSF